MPKLGFFTLHIFLHCPRRKAESASTPCINWGISPFHNFSLAQHLQGDVIKANINREKLKPVSLPFHIALLRVNQVTKRGKYFSNDLPKDFRDYIRSKVYSRDGQLGSASYIRVSQTVGSSGYNWFELSTFLYFISQDSYWNFNHPFCSHLWLKSSFHLGVKLPWGPIFSFSTFMACPLASHALHLWCLYFTSLLEFSSNTVFV